MARKHREATAGQRRGPRGRKGVGRTQRRAKSERDFSEAVPREEPSVDGRDPWDERERRKLPQQHNTKGFSDHASLAGQDTNKAFSHL